MSPFHDPEVQGTDHSDVLLPWLDVCSCFAGCLSVFTGFSGLGRDEVPRRQSEMHLDVISSRIQTCRGLIGEISFDCDDSLPGSTSSFDYWFYEDGQCAQEADWQDSSGLFTCDVCPRDEHVPPICGVQGATGQVQQREGLMR